MLLLNNKKKNVFNILREIIVKGLYAGKDLC